MKFESYSSTKTNVTGFALGYTRESGNLVLILKNDTGEEFAISLVKKNWEYLKDQGDSIIKQYHLE